MLSSASPAISLSLPLFLPRHFLSSSPSSLSPLSLSLCYFHYIFSFHLAFNRFQDRFVFLYHCFVVWPVEGGRLEAQLTFLFFFFFIIGPFTFLHEALASVFHQGTNTKRKCHAPFWWSSRRFMISHLPTTIISTSSTGTTLTLWHMPSQSQPPTWRCVWVKMVSWHLSELCFQLSHVHLCCCSYWFLPLEMIRAVFLHKNVDQTDGNSCSVDVVVAAT